MPARSGAVSRSARVCVRVCRGGAARRGTPRRARRHRLARAARAASSAWQPFAADVNDGGGRRANGRLVATRVPRRGCGAAPQDGHGRGPSRRRVATFFTGMFPHRHSCVHFTSSLL